GLPGGHLMDAHADVESGDELAAELPERRGLRGDVTEPRGELAAVEVLLQRIPGPERIREPELPDELLRDRGVLLAEVQPLLHPLDELVLVLRPQLAGAALERGLPLLHVRGEVLDELPERRDVLEEALTDLGQVPEVLEQARRLLDLRGRVLLLGLLLERAAAVLERTDLGVEPRCHLAAPALAEGLGVGALPLRAVGDQHREPGAQTVQGVRAIAHQLGMLAELFGVRPLEPGHLSSPLSSSASCPTGRGARVVRTHPSSLPNTVRR